MLVGNQQRISTSPGECMHAVNVMISRTHASTRAYQQCLPAFGGCMPIDVLLKTATLGGGGDVVPEFTGRICPARFQTPLPTRDGTPRFSPVDLTYI